MSKDLHIYIFKFSTYGNFQIHRKIEKNNGPLHTYNPVSIIINIFANLASSLPPTDFFPEYIKASPR